MMEADIIEPVEESKWISHMVVQENKQGGIRICVDLRKINDSCLHDPFPTPFINEVLRMLEAKKNIHSKMDYQDTIISK
jgi:hypothetical protein